MWLYIWIGIGALFGTIAFSFAYLWWTADDDDDEDHWADDHPPERVDP